MATETKVKQCLKKFGFNKFRSDIQEKAILSILNGNSDVFISFPTGAGKSLCYQFPAVYKEDGLSLVISPLLALIQDQVTGLNDKQIVARTLNSTLSQQEKKIVLGDLMQRQPTTRLLYITPELAATQSFLSIIKKVHQRKLINYLIIDEAHCVSQWGHDYRPDYLKLGTLHDELSNVPCIAVTATASKQVIDDIYRSLHLRQPVLEFKSSVFRSNLFYDVQFKELFDDPFDDLCHFITDIEKITNTQSNSGIIYCRTRESCTNLSIKLTQTGKYGTVKAYHAGLTNDKRKQIQDDWMNGSVSIICATISFGMGIDKGDVRFVIHWDLAKSISGYYQESGRAGRDGKRSHCRMYYSARERDTQLFLINQEINDKKIGDEQKTSMLNGFNSLVKYCEEVKCRHMVICNYFGDMSMKSCETMCDVCTQHELVSVNLQNLKKKKFDENTNRRSTNRIVYRDEGSEEQYEGGRTGNRREEREYHDTDDNYRHEDEIETAKLATKLVQSELKRRTAGIEMKPKLWVAAGANCSLIDPSNRKIPNLTVQLREHVYRKLKEALMENVEKHFSYDEAQRITHEAACSDKAIWLEHQVFLATKSEAMYKMKYMSKCNEITKATKTNASLYIIDSMPTTTNTDLSSSPTSSKRKFSETELNSTTSNEPESKILKQNGHTDNQQQDKSNQPSLSPINTENKSPNRRRSLSSSSTTSSSSSSSSSSSNSSSSSSSSSSSTSSKITSPKIKVNNGNDNKSPKSSTLKRSNGEAMKEKKNIKLFNHSLSTSTINSKSQSTTSRRNSLIIPPNKSDVKAKQARGTLKTCLESMSNFLHQKLNEQSSSTHLTIQSPNEEPIPPQGSSSPSFLNDQQQQILNVNRQRQTSLDERIQSLINNNSDENKTAKELPKANIRKSLPMPPGTSKSNDEHKQTSSKKRSISLGSNGKSTSKKSSSSSLQNKRLSSTSTSSNNRKSSTKKSRDSKLPVNIKTISEVVVDVLNPFYQANRFSSKELFKTLAKRISQDLASKEFSNIDAVRMDAKSLIKPAFRHKHTKILTHADLDRIVPP